MNPTSILILELIEDGLSILKQFLAGQASEKDLKQELSTWTAKLEGVLHEAKDVFQSNDALIDAERKRKDV